MLITGRTSGQQIIMHVYNLDLKISRLNNSPPKKFCIYWVVYVKFPIIKLTGLFCFTAESEYIYNDL